MMEGEQEIHREDVSPTFLTHPWGAGLHPIIHPPHDETIKHRPYQSVCGHYPVLRSPYVHYTINIFRHPKWPQSKKRITFIIPLLAVQRSPQSPLFCSQKTALLVCQRSAWWCPSGVIWSASRVSFRRCRGLPTSN